jgi:hypothetical protein
MAEESENKITADINQATSQAAGLILNKLEMVYPSDSKFRLVRQAILSALGDRGLKMDIKKILELHGVVNDD